MVRESNSADSATNGGGEGSAVGNTLAYKLPSLARVHGYLKKLVLMNRTGVATEFLVSDEDATGTAAAAVVPLIIPVAAGQTVVLTDKDFGEFKIYEGIMYQCLHAATGNGAKVRAEVDVCR